MAGATITRGRLRGHLCAVPLAGAAVLMFRVASSWAQAPYDTAVLPACEVYPPGAAPAIGPSNCTPLPAALWGPVAKVPDPIRPPLVDTHAVPAAAPQVPIAVRSPVAVSVPKPAAPGAPSPASPPEPAMAPKPPAPQAVVSLKTQGAVTLDQIGVLLGPASKRTIAFALSSADAYKTGDLTHRVRLTWTGPLQALVDQLGQVYGLDVAIDDTTIRFSSRQGERAGDPSTTRAP